MLIHNFLEHAAHDTPGKVAVIHDDVRITYAELEARAANLATHLWTYGVTRGQRVALLLENSIEYIIAYYATLKAGGVATPLNPGLKPDGLHYLLNEIEPAAIVTGSKSERLLKATDLTSASIKLLVIHNPKQHWNDCRFITRPLNECIDDPASSRAATSPVSRHDLSSIVYTSGSTGTPKGVMLSHRNVVANTEAIRQSLDITPADIQMVVLPFFYVMGKSLLNTHVSAGATIVINNRFMYPADVINQMIEERVTSFSGVPSTYAYLLNRSPLAGRKNDLDALKYCSQAGGHMANSLKLQLRQALPEHTRIFIMYGATEAAARLTCLDPQYFDTKMGSIGKPISGVTVRVIDQNQREMMDGQEGELVAAGPNIMQGYWKSDIDTGRALTVYGYHTGDMGYRDPDGFLFLTGRKDGLLKVGGHRINPLEIEDFLMATDQLIEATVVGIPDTMMGNKLIAVVVAKQETADAKNLREACSKNLPAHKVPSEILLTRALPKNANGKIDRAQCVKLAVKKE